MVFNFVFWGFVEEDATLGEESSNVKPASSSEEAAPATPEIKVPVVEEKPVVVEEVPEPSPEEPSKQSETISSPVSLPDFGNLTTRFVYCLARNLYTIKKIALFLAFVINLMLLFYKVSSYIPGSGEVDDDVGSGSAEVTGGNSGGGSGGGSGSGEDDGSEEDVIEWIQMEESWYYLEPLLRSLAMIHSLLSFFMLIAYYNLKVPLIIFKREKEIARNIEFDGLYISEQPEDNYTAYWDKLVISTKSFPVNYWDKFVKKRVVAKYAEQYDYEALSVLLGMTKSSSSNLEETSTGMLSFITNCDWKYQIWKVGVTFMDNVLCQIKSKTSIQFYYQNQLLFRFSCTIWAILSCRSWETLATFSSQLIFWI